jgi:hypothetical protein
MASGEARYVSISCELPQTVCWTAGVPAEVETVRRRFEQWRSQGTRGARPIPDRLRDQAVRLAQQYGVSRISKILRVGYYSLKDRVDRHTAPTGCGSENLPPVTFVDLGTPAPSPGLACLVEWEDTSGAKMRVQLQAIKASAVVALSRSFWEGRG